MSDMSATVTGLGSITRIDTAGAYVNKSGAHGLGEAFDLDAIYWSSGQSCQPINQSHSNPNLKARRRYIALDCFARRTFKYVLDGYYNSAHHDHIHMDTVGGALVLNKGYRSDVVFVRAMCNAMLGTSLVIDGDYGPATDSAYRTLKDRANITGDTSGSSYY